MNTCKDTGTDVKIYKLKVLPTKPVPNAIYFIRADGATEVSTYITDTNGIPWPLKGSGGGSGIQTITNTDGTIVVTGTSSTVLNLSTAIKNLINSALQSGDNISELINDAGYLTIADIPSISVNLQSTASPTNVVIDNSGGTDATILAATTTNAGVLLPSDKVKLDNTTNINTGDNSPNTLYSGLVSNATHTGDATGSTTLTLATVNSNVGSFGTATNVPQYTVNGKGLITASANTPIQITESQVTNLVSDLAGKQPTLTAGTNITIVGNTISSTGGSGISNFFTPSIGSTFTALKSYYSRIGNVLTIQLNFSFTPISPSYTGTTSFTVPNSYTVAGIVIGRKVGAGVLTSGANTTEGTVIVSESAAPSTLTLAFGGTAFNTSLVHYASLTIMVEVN